MNVIEQLKADAQALRDEAAAKITQAEVLEKHAASAVGTWMTRELAEVKAMLETIPAEVRAIPAELHGWISAHL